MITKIKVGKLVKRLREKKLMEQKDLASHLEISQATLSNIENGKRKVQPAIAIKLAKLFEVEVEKFLCEEV